MTLQPHKEQQSRAVDLELWPPMNKTFLPLQVQPFRCLPVEPPINRLQGVLHYQILWSQVNILTWLGNFGIVIYVATAITPILAIVIVLWSKVIWCYLADFNKIRWTKPTMVLLTRFWAMVFQNLRFCTRLQNWNWSYCMCSCSACYCTLVRHGHWKSLTKTDYLPLKWSATGGFCTFGGNRKSGMKKWRSTLEPTIDILYNKFRDTALPFISMVKTVTTGCSFIGSQDGRRTLQCWQTSYGWNGRRI